MSDAARAKAFLESILHGDEDHRLWLMSMQERLTLEFTQHTADQTAALREENARLRTKYRRLMGHHRYVCACELASDAALSEIDCDPEGQRGEEWRALEQENESLRAVMRDVAGNCEELARMEGIEKAEQRTWQSIASRLRSVAVERARQAP